MKTSDELIEAMTATNARFDLAERSIDRAISFDPDAVFFAPLIALTILLVARAHKDMHTTDAAVWTAATLTEHFAGLEGLGPRLDRSVALRRRCVDALVFLENTNLVCIGKGPDRVVECTPGGQAFIRAAVQNTDDLGLLARGLVRAHSHVNARGLLLW